MSRTVNHEEYITTEEAIHELKASRKRFYENVKPDLTVYHFDGKKTPWYRKSAILALKGEASEKPAQDSAIVISGTLTDWTKYVRSIGYQADTLTREIKENVTLPEELAKMFDIPANRLFMERPRITYTHQVPICAWETYYPMELVAGDIIERVKQGSLDDIVQAMRDMHGVAPGIGRDKYISRLVTPVEQELLQVPAGTPTLILYRINYTRERKTLIFVSRMTLLRGFEPEHEYEIHNWD